MKDAPRPGMFPSWACCLLFGIAVLLAAGGTFAIVVGVFIALSK